MTLDWFLPYMLIELPGCPQPLVKQALLSAASEFCRRTHAWSEVQEPIELQPGVRDYELDAPSGARVCVALDVMVNNRPLRPLRPMLPEEESCPVWFNMAIERGMLSLYPTPTQAETMRVRAAYEPTEDAQTLPDFLGHDYLGAMTGGTKAILMAIPGKTWSHPDLVPYHRQKFDDAVVEALADELHGRTVGAVTLRPVRFGAWT